MTPPHAPADGPADTSSDRSAHGPADGHLWPNEEQQLLLRAALEDGPGAGEAYRAWRARVDVDAEFGWAALRLMPLVYHNLARLGVSDPLLPRLKGVYRRAWVETHQLFRRAGPAVAALAAADVPVLLLKGVPLALAYYQTPGLRPMSDVDVCVPHADARRAIDVLAAAGWRPTSAPSDDHVRFFHALQFRHPDGGEMDLHWHVMVESRAVGADAALWQATEPLAFEGTAVRQLAPTPLLLHTVLHGVRWNVETPIRWIPDAVAVLRARGAEVDWQALVALARRLHVTHRVGLGLAYLARTTGAPVPAHVLDALGRTRPSLAERIEATVLLRDAGAVIARARGYHWSIVGDFARVVDPGARPLAFAATYPHYLRYRLGLGGRRDLVPLAWRGVRSRLARLGRGLVAPG